MPPIKPAQLVKQTPYKDQLTDITTVKQLKDFLRDNELKAELSYKNGLFVCSICTPKGLFVIGEDESPNLVHAVNRAVMQTKYVLKLNAID